MAIFFIFFMLIPFVDECLKMQVRSICGAQTAIVTCIPFLKIVFVKNFGAAFGAFPGARYFFIAISVSVVAILICAVIFKKQKSALFILACSFVAGGATGNLIDRIFCGFVTDYLKFSFFSPVCNLSDYFIFSGFVLFALWTLKNSKKSVG